MYDGGPVVAEDEERFEQELYDVSMARTASKRLLPPFLATAAPRLRRLEVNTTRVSLLSDFYVCAQLRELRVDMPFHPTMWHDDNPEPVQGISRLESLLVTGVTSPHDMVLPGSLRRLELDPMGVDSPPLPQLLSAATGLVQLRLKAQQTTRRGGPRSARARCRGSRRCLWNLCSIYMTIRGS